MNIGSNSNAKRSNTQFTFLFFFEINANHCSLIPIFEWFHLRILVLLHLNNQYPIDICTVSCSNCTYKLEDPNFKSWLSVYVSIDAFGPRFKSYSGNNWITKNKNKNINYKHNYYYITITPGHINLVIIK